MGVKRGDENESVGRGGARGAISAVRIQSERVFGAASGQNGTTRARTVQRSPESLWGRIDAKAFGDRARHRDDDDDGRKKKTTTTNDNDDAKSSKKGKKKKNHLNAETGDDALEAFGGYSMEKERGPAR